MSDIEKLTKELIKNLHDNSNEEHSIHKLSTKQGLITFYKSQLRKFIEKGVGKRTSNQVMISPQLINITIRRLNQIKGGIL